jgi:hypothetical protein
MDRLLWVWLYRVWPRCLKVMVLVKSATWSSGIVRASGFIGISAHGRDGRERSASCVT